MDASPEPKLDAAALSAASRILPGPAPALPAVGAHSLRELVEHAVAEAEAQAIRRALATANGNKSVAARFLQTNYTTLHAKMKRFRISSREFRRS